MTMKAEASSQDLPEGISANSFRGYPRPDCRRGRTHFLFIGPHFVK